MSTRRNKKYKLIFTSIGHDLNIVLDSRATVIHESDTVPALHKQTFAIKMASTVNTSVFLTYIVCCIWQFEFEFEVINKVNKSATPSEEEPSQVQTINKFVFWYVNVNK